MQAFRLNGSRVLEIDLAGDAVRATTGAMIAYTGDVSFGNAGLGGGDGLRSALKRRVTGESISLMQCSGRGTVWFAKDAPNTMSRSDSFMNHDAIGVPLRPSTPQPSG